MTQYLKIKELALMFNVTEQTIFNWIRNKGLPKIKIGKSTRIPKDQLDEWLDSQNKGVK